MSKGYTPGKILPNENERIKALEDYSILDTLPEKHFDDITKLASAICGTPISLISLIDPERQWFKSHHGLGVSETPRDFAFCSHAINNPNEPFIITDSRKDPRFAGNPLVTADPFVIFYAGIPLVDPDGFALGTLCVIDNEPRKLTKDQLEALQTLANQTVQLFDLRKKNQLLKETEQILKNKNNSLEQFAYTVSHDIKSPLNNLQAVSEMLLSRYDSVLDETGKQGLVHLKNSSMLLKNLVDGILNFYKNDDLLQGDIELINVTTLIKDILSIVHQSDSVEINYPINNPKIICNASALKQILINLIVNAIKYNDKKKGEIKILFKETEKLYHFTVKDNGRGIEEEHLETIFDLFSHLGVHDRNQELGHGIGLASVKNLVERLGGKITVKSEPSKGSEFSFTISK